MKRFAVLLACSLATLMGVTRADEASIRSFLATREDAFNREDVQWLVDRFTEDAEHVDSRGTTVKGRAAIGAAYRELFHAPAHRDVRTKQVVEEVRSVTPDVAIVTASWALSNLKDDAGAAVPDRGGRSVLVLVKAGGEWKIDLLRADLKVHAANPR
jgi:uncharacterized protein (TIGR02246 family)